MSQTITGLTLMENVIRRGGLGLWLEAADVTLAADSITSETYLRNSRHGTSHWRSRNAGWWRPSAATAADYWRPAGDLISADGTLEVEDSYSDTTATSEVFGLLDHGIRPWDLRDAANRALRKLYFTNEEPLSTKPIDTTIADSGFQNSGTTSYTVGATGTFSKVSTANDEVVFPGYISSGRFQAAATNDYIRQRFAVNAGETVRAFTLSMLDAGTGPVETILFDATNSAAVGTTIEHSQRAWQWVKRSEVVPDDCKLMDLRLASESANGDFYANAFIFYRTKGLRLILDTKWDTEFKAPMLAYVDIGRGFSASEGVYDAFGADILPIPEDDYSFITARGAANPYAIQFNQTPTNPGGSHWFEYPILIAGRRAHSDVDGPFDLTMAQTTSADLDLLAWVTLIELFENPAILSRVPNATTVLAKCHEEFEKVRGQFRYAPSVKRKPVLVWRGLGN